MASNIIPELNALTLKYKINEDFTKEIFCNFNNEPHILEIEIYTTN